VYRKEQSKLTADLQSSIDACNELQSKCSDLSNTLVDERLVGQQALEETRRSLSEQLQLSEEKSRREAKEAEEEHSARYGESLGQIMVLQSELEVMLLVVMIWMGMMMMMMLIMMAMMIDAISFPTTVKD
jgi:hypothetical protein